MASIFDRLAGLVKAGISDLADDLKDPSESVDEYLGKLLDDLADVREKTQAIIEDERRAADALAKNLQDAQRYEELAKAALRAGNESDARKFLKRKVELAEQSKPLQEAYDTIHETADKMRRLHDDLVGRINQINERKRAAQSRSDAAEARIQVAETAGGGSSKREADILEALDTLEERTLRQEGQAEAHKVALEDPFASLERTAVPTFATDAPATDAPAAPTLADDTPAADSTPSATATPAADDSIEALERRLAELKAARDAEEAELARLRAELDAMG